MLLLLPPSEGKAPGGDGGVLDLDGLSFPELTAVRRTLVAALVRLARREPRKLRAALGLGVSQGGEVAADAALRTSPTAPALQRYNGVLYDELGYGTLPAAARRRADTSVVVASALFGLVRPGDRIPYYRLSGTTALPGVRPLRALWRPALSTVLQAQPGLVVDLRSAAYAALAPVPGSLQVRVLREQGGRRTVVSHDNKYTKGRLARQLCLHGARTAGDVAAHAASVADRVELDGTTLDLVLHGLASGRPEGQVGG